MTEKAAVITAIFSFIGMTSCEDLGPMFWIMMAIFAASTEYVYLYMYANEQFIDETYLEEHRDGYIE